MSGMLDSSVVPMTDYKQSSATFACCDWRSEKIFTVDESENSIFRNMLESKKFFFTVNYRK